MGAKPPKNGMEEPEAQYRQEESALSEAELEAWFKRNADALNESIRRSREEYARGHSYTLDEVMAKVRAEIERVAKKA